ncbi:MAG: carbohydrate binding domain-containing protein [Planctomycetaceae bacterium]|nr:carbohydrate binding domain-containing protein [Planctomycetaceae bacterium]
MTLRHIFLSVVCLALIASAPCFGQSLVKVSPKPMHQGKIDAKLFGNFVELLDDVVPSIWAEMINDRDFDGIIPSAEWCYYRGEPNVYLDQAWEPNTTWSRVQENAFCGSHAAQLTPINGQAAISQPGMYVAKGQTYDFTGWFRASADVTVTVTLKTLLPDGEWFSLATTSETLKADAQWQKLSAKLTSRGTTDRTVFELSIKGESELMVDQLSLMPSDNLNGWRKDAIELIRPIKPAIVRWGGSVCDPGGYRWKNGIGPRDRRVSFHNTVWGRIDSNDVGIDEFIQFCRLVGAEPLICVSFSDGPENAADMVRYCNDPPTTEWGKRRAENGFPEPHNIKYFQLGNELGGNDYAEKCVAFCAAMKAADPEVLLAASYPSQRLFDLVGKEIAFVCPHHYTSHFADHEREIGNLINMIRSTPNCDHIRLGITEWAFTAGDWGNGRARLQSLYSGLYSAQYFNLMMRHSDYVVLACRSNISNSFEGGTIMTKPGAVMKTPFYHTTKLYADHFQPIPLTVETSPPGVDTVACVSEDGKTVSLFFVNTNRHPVDIRFDFSDWTGEPRFQSGAMVIDAENRGQLDIVNHWAAPDRITTVPLESKPTTLPRYSTVVVVFEK